MPNVMFYNARVGKTLQSLAFPKRAITGICVRVPGKIDNLILDNIKNSMEISGLKRSVISPENAVYKTSAFNDPLHYIGKFSYVNMPKKSKIISELPVLHERTSEVAKRTIADNFNSAFYENEYEGSCDLFYIGFITHEYWTPEDTMFPLLSKTLESKEIVATEMISGSGGYRVVTATFPHYY